jgi:hypothetical protein
LNAVANVPTTSLSSNLQKRRVVFRKFMSRCFAHHFKWE